MDKCLAESLSSDFLLMYTLTVPIGEKSYKRKECGKVANNGSNNWIPFTHLEN